MSTAYVVPYSTQGTDGHLACFLQEDADIVILTETKRNDGQPIPQDPVLKAKYPYQKWAYSAQKGYAGTAILSRIPPLSSYVCSDVQDCQIASSSPVC